MARTSMSLPADHVLIAGIRRALAGRARAGRDVALVRREPNAYTSTYPSEVLTCRLDGGAQVRLLCKHQTAGEIASAGHRGDLRYEAAVYERVLEPGRFSTPSFFGLHEDAASGHTWLMLEHLDDTLRLGKGPVPQAMLQATRWVARFHAAHEARVGDARLAFLHAYDPAYYRGWSGRAARFAAPLRRRHPWFAELCERFARLVVEEWSGPPTVIHGEYYPKNILLRGDTIHPVDWQSAAVACGELDLAALTDGRWDPAIVRRCENEYRAARWPAGSPAEFERRLGIGRMYFHLRWLGDRPEWTTHPDCDWRFERLRALAGRMELL